MIIVKLQGGLGNQLFQYAMGRALADRNGQALFLDLQYLQDRTPRGKFTYRNYELGKFRIRANIATPDQIRKVAAYPQNRLDLYRKRLLTIIGAVNYVQENSFAYQPVKILPKRVNYISGFWQSQQYFTPESAAIRQDLLLNVPLDKANETYLKMISSCNAVSLHVRRGDYVGNETHPVCDMSYYSDAVNLINSRVNEAVYFIFSDDLAWVSEHIRIDGPYHVINGNESQSYFDLLLMSHCQHHIIANSSFSWWGAWLNPKPGKIVVTPKKWFNGQHMDTKNLLPDNWIKL